MTGKIMIVDGVATNRILMKVRLASACYDVTAFGSANEAIHSLRQKLPDIVLIGSALSDMSAIDLCRLIRSLPGCSSLPVMMQVHMTQRLAALSAGATAIVDMTGDELTLFARIRRLLRDKNSGFVDDPEALLPVDPHSGLQEASAVFEHQSPLRIAFVTNRSASAIGWRLALQQELGHQIITLDQEQALAQTHESETADTYLIALDADQPGDGLQLLSELRSRGHSRHAAFLVILNEKESNLTPVALDLGAGDVLPDIFSASSTAAEAALRIHKQLDRKRIADRRRKAAEHNRIWAMKDPLTDLFNRRYALPCLGKMAAHAIRNNQPLAVIVMDIDYFKRVNDLYGHASGDAVLIAVAQRLGKTLPESGLLARIGGEEFLIAYHPGQDQSVETLADRFRSVIADTPYTLPDLPHISGIHVTASLGGAVTAVSDLHSAACPQTLIARADRALLQAKAQGRNQVVMSNHAEMA